MERAFQKRCLILGLLLAAYAGNAQMPFDHAIPGGPSRGKQEVGLTASYFFYDGKNRVTYSDVVVTNVQGTLQCKRLTIDLPAAGALQNQPTNAVAETNVVIDFVRSDETNHITCDRAVYAYNVRNGITNDTITFMGSSVRPAKVENGKGWMTGEPLIYDNLSGDFSGVNTVTHFEVPSTSEAGPGTTNLPKP